mgnify:CR=1 FL=1
MEELEVVIGKNGRIEMRARGMKGPGCEKIKDWVAEQGLGNIAEENRTHEYYEQQQTGTLDQNRSGF